MGRIYVWIAICISVLFCGCWPQMLSAQDTAVAGKTSSLQIFYQGEKVLANVKSSHYRHTTEIDESVGLYNLDCSALICFLLSRAAPQALSSVPIDPLHRHARAINFYSTFVNAPQYQSGQGWQRVVRLMDAEPGDIIAWRKDPLPPKGNTGHVMMIMAKPVTEDAETVRVLVMDSSRSGHFRDTRKKGSGGVGVGIMWFRVDRDGHPVAFYWSSKGKKAVPMPIAIGRAMYADSIRPD